MSLSSEATVTSSLVCVGDAPICPDNCAVGGVVSFVQLVMATSDGLKRSVFSNIGRKHRNTSPSGSSETSTLNFSDGTCGSLHPVLTLQLSRTDSTFHLKKAIESAASNCSSIFVRLLTPFGLPPTLNKAAGCCELVPAARRASTSVADWPPQATRVQAAKAAEINFVGVRVPAIDTLSFLIIFGTWIGKMRFFDAAARRIVGAIFLY